MKELDESHLLDESDKKTLHSDQETYSNGNYTGYSNDPEYAKTLFEIASTEGGLDKLTKEQLEIVSEYTRR